MDILAPTTRVVKPAHKPAPEPPAYTFTDAQWLAFRNGVQCSLMGYTGRELADLRGQWARVNRAAWDQGWQLAETMTRRADVQLALALRFGGMEE